VNLDENLGDAKDFLTQHPSKFNVATDTEQQCAKAFALKAMPSSYLIDRNGIIRYQHLGFKTGEAEQVKTLINQLLAESPKN
jgi:peroxiredoxin